VRAEAAGADNKPAVVVCFAADTPGFEPVPAAKQESANMQMLAGVAVAVG